jgi:hypothetical protein
VRRGKSEIAREARLVEKKRDVQGSTWNGNIFSEDAGGYKDRFKVDKLQTF